MGDNPPKTNVVTTPRTGRNKTPWTLTKLAPRQPPPSHNIITVISSLPYITTSTPLSPLSANDSLPSPPLDPSNLNPFFDFSHLRQLLISCAASRRPLPLLRGRPTPPKQCNIAIRTPRGWETTPSDTSPASFRNIARNVLGVQVPFVPDPDIEAHIAQSTTALVHQLKGGRDQTQPGATQDVQITHTANKLNMSFHADMFTLLRPVRRFLFTVVVQVIRQSPPRQTTSVRRDQNGLHTLHLLTRILMSS